MNIAIVGYGTVGSGVKEILDKAVGTHTKKLHVRHIFIRKGKQKTHPRMIDDIQTILQDTTCDLVVEALGGIEPAHTYILQALQSGKHVVTANKAVVAKYLKEFTECANANNVKFYYEATTGGGIPWISGLTKAMRIDEISHIQGIFNGTSNYILDHMQRYGSGFSEILATAQQLGYAEADPSADIEGYDICNKLRISASLAYNYHLPDTVPVFGIRNLTKKDIAYFKTLKRNVRFIGKTWRYKTHYSGAVEPTLFPIKSLESNTPDNYNLITLHGDTLGELKFFGAGAGKFPTANAIVQDILDITEGVPHLCPTFSNAMQYDKTLCLSDYIVRASNEARNILRTCTYDIESFEDIAYIHIKKIEVYRMHSYMKEIMHLDENAFMASIYEEEGL